MTINLHVYLQTYERVSIQRCESAPAEQEDIDRLGTKATYAFVYPNFMINRCSGHPSEPIALTCLSYMYTDLSNQLIFRYGPWMDTNLAVPLDATRCKVVFDYFLDESLLVHIRLSVHTSYSMYVLISQ
jgi:choline monooxygenase